jgi:hypothetical protein
MKRIGLLLVLALSACSENLPHTQPPMDHFFFPAGLALTPVAGGNQQALLVVSANFDLRYDRQAGATLLSVDPRLDAAGGSTGRPDQALVKFGSGAQLGSYAGPVAIADANTCTKLAGGARAFVASRYTRKLYQFPLGAGGAVDPCPAGATCEVALATDLLDPAAVGLACQADGKRQSVFVGYLRAPAKDGFAAETAWLSEFDLGNLAAAPRTFPLGLGPVGDMAYDALTDRLYAVGRYAGLTAPLFILDLPSCKSSDQVTTDNPNGCQAPRVQTVDLYGSLAGAELAGIALSNPRPGRPRRAYVSVRLYDEGYANAIRARPPFDVGGALMVIDLEENAFGRTLAKVLSVIPIGLGAGAVRVLPVRPGLADLVVVPCSGDGTIQLYDDEAGAVVRVVGLDETTGAPEAGHVPYAAAVEDRGTEALVYVASFRDWTVSVLKVPMADPTSADLLRDPISNKPLRIGSPNQ